MCASRAEIIERINGNRVTWQQRQVVRRIALEDRLAEMKRQQSGVQFHRVDAFDRRVFPIDVGKIRVEIRRRCVAQQRDDLVLFIARAQDPVPRRHEGLARWQQVGDPHAGSPFVPQGLRYLTAQRDRIEKTWRNRL